MSTNKSEIQSNLSDFSMHSAKNNEKKNSHSLICFQESGDLD